MLVASFVVVSPTRLCSPASLARQVRVRLVRRDARSRFAQKETGAHAPVSMFVVFTTFTTATTMTHIIRAEIEKGARSIEVWFARAAMGGVPGIVCIPFPCFCSVMWCSLFWCDHDNASDCAGALYDGFLCAVMRIH